MNSRVLPAFCAVFVAACITAIAKVKAGEPTGMADTSPSNSNITSVIRSNHNSGSLVIQRKNVDLLSVNATAPGGLVPRLQDAHMEGDKLAVVLDYDSWFSYRTYQLINGSWTPKESVLFNAINLGRRQRMELVEVTDLTHVTITYNNGSDTFRRKKIVQPGDVRDIFEFTTNGILKNGAAYVYNSGSESN